MDLSFSNKRISGLLLCLPSEISHFDDEVSNYSFPPERTQKLKEIMGYKEHRIASPGTTVSDMAAYALNLLFEREMLDKNSIDALILVTQSPDYLMPPTSSVIHGRLDLKRDIFCIDINQGCAGYLIGLIQAMTLLEQKNINRAVLINADLLSLRTSKKDRNSYPLIGDGLTITVVDSADSEEIHANVFFDGSGHQALIIPAGGFAKPTTIETMTPKDSGDGNERSENDLRMDGTAVFNFVQTEVPPMIEALKKSAGVSDTEIDAYAFHQPNRFMLEKLADKLEVPRCKMPANIVEKYGNGSGITVPTVLIENFQGLLLSKEMNVCLAGFGVGLTWSSMLIRIGNLDFCEKIEF
jgi:3-oxoacyl-[acyl-carrier-protein] synthase III